MTLNILNKKMMMCLSGILSGMLVAMSSVMYLNCEIKEIGALIFGAALLFISLMGFSLFTGKVGSPAYTKWLPYMLIGNMLGAILVGCVMGLSDPALADKALQVVINKQSVHPFLIILKGAFCGMLMYLCVTVFCSTSRSEPIFAFAGIILGIAVFVLAGFEHSIANTAYVAMSLTESSEAWMMVLYSLIGNSIGSIFMRQSSLLVFQS